MTFLARQSLLLSMAHWTDARDKLGSLWFIALLGKNTHYNVFINNDTKKIFQWPEKKQHQETTDLKLNEQEVSRRPKVQCTLAIGQGIWSFQAPHLQTQDQLALCHGRASWAFSGSKDSLLRWELYHCVGHPLVQEPSKVVHFRKWGAQLIVQVISLWPLEERRFVPFFPVEKDPGTAQIVIHHRHALPCCRHRSELKSFGTGVFPAVKRVVFHTCSWATSYAWKPKQSICPPNPPPMQLLRW